jgi:hypothetical protein
VQVNVDGVESNEEITEDILLDLRDVGEKGADDVFSGGELV